MRAITNTAGVLLFALALLGCTVTIVEEYDPVLDQGLTTYQADVAAFMARMSAKAGKPEGRFRDADVQAFYARTSAQLQSFVDRAEALDEDGKCLPANYVGLGVKKVVGESADFLRAYGPELDEVEDIADVIEDFGEEGEELSSGNCTVIVLKVVKANHELVRRIHEENDSLPSVVTNIAGPILDQSVRIAIKNEVLKKTRAG